MLTPASWTPGMAAARPWLHGAAPKNFLVKPVIHHDRTAFVCLPSSGLIRRTGEPQGGCSMCCPTTVDHNALPCDVSTGVARQQEKRTIKVVRKTMTLDERIAKYPLLKFWDIDDRLVDLGRDEARRKGVDADSEAAPLRRPLRVIASRPPLLAEYTAWGSRPIPTPATIDPMLMMDPSPAGTAHARVTSLCEYDWRLKVD